MKKILTLALAFSCGAALAQKADNVGIGTTKPDPSAILDLNSNTKGLLLPRMSQAQRDAIKNPAAGLVIFQTDQVVGTYTFDGTAWQPSNARTSAVSSVGAWDKQGNLIDDTDFLGSTNDKPLVFKIFNVFAGKITSGQNTFIGFQAGENATGAANTAFGARSLKVSQGINNTAFGSGVLQNNTTGYDNVGIGTAPLNNNISGSENFGLGAFALFNNQLGSGNIAIGRRALYTTNSNSNLAIGANALENTTGSGNIAIGPNAGQFETGSNTLYISNSSTANPLIKGQFYSTIPAPTTPWLRINLRPTPVSPTPSTVGYLAIGDFDTAPGAAGAGGLGLPANFSGGPYRLYVQDGIMTEKLKVALRNSTDWADYVFAKDYQLMPLDKVEEFVKKNNHLPNVPSADEMAKNGLDVMQTSSKLMEKIEELTLYIIELNKEIKLLKERQ